MSDCVPDCNCCMRGCGARTRAAAARAEAKKRERAGSFTGGSAASIGVGGNENEGAWPAEIWRSFVVALLYGGNVHCCFV